MGLGCGYHVHCLVAKFPEKQVIVVELNRLVVAWYFKHRKEVKAQIVSADLLGDDFLRPLLATKYSVVSHFASAQFRNLYYRDLSLFLLGRTAEGASLALSTLSETPITLGNSENLISINDIKTAIEKRKCDDFYKTWTCLGELVV